MFTMATGNKLMKEITDQFLHCKICYEPYKDPKTLVCLHTFCCDCLQQHVDSDSNRSSRFLLYSRYIACPLCRRKTEIPTGGVRRLPDNFLVSSLNDVIVRKRVGKFPPCEICNNDKPRHNNAAVHKCLDCVKLLCKSCVDLHMTTKVTQHHSLIDIEGEKDIECKNHPEELVRFYCEPCDECICVVCTFQEHRDHEICSFSDGFSKYRAGLDTLLGQCKDRLQDVQGRLQSINKVEVSLKETRENIRDLAISYISQVRSTEKQLMQRVDQEFGDKVQGFLQNKEWLQENQDGLQTACNLAEIIMNDRGIEMLLLKRDLQNKLSTLLEPALPPEPENLSHDIKFVPGNVKLGYISLNNDEDGDHIADDGGAVENGHCADGWRPPKKRLCLTSETQTSQASTPTADSADMNFVVPPSTPVNEFQPYHSIVTIVNGNVIADDNETNKTDVSVNTMCSMADRNIDIFGSDETITPGTCVQCSAELKKDHMHSSSMGALPIVDGTAPAIQDIIITNSLEGTKDGRGGRRRRSLIKSRRVQTDISLSNDDISDDSLLRVSSQESLSSGRKYSSSNSLPPLLEPVETRTIGLDPINISPRVPEVQKPMMRTRAVNTVQEVRPVVDTKSVRTNTVKTDVKDARTMTFPDLHTTDTQTPEKITVNKKIATDYAGQSNKHTSTRIISTIDSGTCMPTLVQESKVTWTDLVQTTERSVCTEGGETTDSATETMQPILIDQGVGVAPETRTVDTNTDILPGGEGSTETAAATLTKDKEKKVLKKEKEKVDKKKKEKEKKEKKEKKAKQMVDSCCSTDPVLSNEKETNTFTVQSKDQWTATVSPQYVNTGISPARPATREAAVATNAVTHMDQGTYTNVISLRDNQTETCIVVCDSETLTERIDNQDAQTSVEIYSESVEVATETCHMVTTACATDTDWLEELTDEINANNVSDKNVCDICKGVAAIKVDNATSPVPTETSEQGTMVLSYMRYNNLIDSQTQTPTINLYDKSIATSWEFDEQPDIFKTVESLDAATSTESLPYIGLFSDIDCDELILVPGIAIDMIGSEIEYEKLYNDSFPVMMVESGMQTIVSAADFVDNTVAQETEQGPEMVKPIGDNLVTVGVNTIHAQTFEKETSMQPAVLMSRGTMTMYMSTIDKSTSTGAYVRAIQDRLGATPVSPKITRIQRKDVAVATDSYLLDEKMVACINKLRNVSEKLQSPTSKTSKELPPWTKRSDSNPSESDVKLMKELDKCSENVRRKNVMELAAKSQAVLKSKDHKSEPTKRKAQPLTTLKGKYPEKDQDVDEQRRGSGRHLSVDQTAVKLGSQTSIQKRTPVTKRKNSAPGSLTIAPPVASPMQKRSPKTSTKTLATGRKSPSPKPPENLSTMPTHKQDSLNPEFYSTVPKTRHQKHGLSSITESRDYARARTPNSTSSSSDALDLSSLKIKTPPAIPSPLMVKKREPKSPPAISTTIEVIPTIELSRETRVRPGSSSSDQTDPEPQQEKKGFMKKLFGSKKKKAPGEKRSRSPSKSPKPPRKAFSAEAKAAPPPPETPKDKPQKAKPFVYMRSRIFAIQQDDEEKFNKQTVSKYSVSRPEDVEKNPMFDFATTFTKK